MSRNKKITKICKVCGEPFNPHSCGKGTYCSILCQRKDKQGYDPNAEDLDAPMAHPRILPGQIPAAGTWEKNNLCPGQRLKLKKKPRKKK